MPCIVPAHQAPALLLKRWRPEWFSGLGLVLGTMAPDLEFVLRIQGDWVVSHTLLAQVYFTAPLTVLLYWLSVELLLPYLVPFLPRGAPFHFEGLGSVARPRASWGTVALSGTVGGLTHIFLDGFTHGGHSGWAVALLPFLRWPVPGLSLPIHDFLQAAFSVGLGIFAVDAWRRRVEEGGPSLAPQAPRSAEARAVLGSFVLAAAAAGIALARHLHPAASGLDALELDAYGAADLAALVVVLCALQERLREGAREGAALLDGA